MYISSAFIYKFPAYTTSLRSTRLLAREMADVTSYADTSNDGNCCGD